MANTETLNVFKFNHRVLHINMEDITNEDSLISPDNGAACINWLIGHLVLSRDEAHQLVGLPGFCSEKYIELFDRGTKGNKVENPIPLEEMMKLFDEAQDTLNEKLDKMDFSGDTKKLDKLTFYAFHESYHVGQIGILRRIIGKEGAIK